MAKKIFAWILYLLPVVGGVTMIWEGARGREITGAILVGKAKLIHILFGILALILDVLLAETIVGDSIVNGALKMIAKGSEKVVVSKVASNKIAKGSERYLGKGFIGRGTAYAAEKTGSKTLTRAAEGIGSMSTHWAGKHVVNYAERKARQKIEHVAEHGKRIAVDKIEELGENNPALRNSLRRYNRREVIEAQKAAKQARQQNVQK